jgi:hypothetical protein
VKTYKHLYVQVYSFENLYHAYRKARKGGKRKHEPAAAFELDLESNLIQLRNRNNPHNRNDNRGFRVSSRSQPSDGWRAGIPHDLRAGGGCPEENSSPRAPVRGNASGQNR